MKSSQTASTLSPSLFWLMLLLSLFAVTVLTAARDGMAARDGGDTDTHDTYAHDTDAHNAELIRQHREAMSPFFSVPKTPHSPRGNQLRNGRALTGERTEEWSFVREARPEIEQMIRPAGNRAKRIRA